MYTTLVRSSKSTNAYTLPFINLMKNTACDVYLGDEGLGYQQAFGYIRQLAIHLRNSMKVKTKVGQSPDSRDCINLTLSLLRRRTSRYIIGSSFIASTSGHSSCQELAIRKRRSGQEKRANSKHSYTRLFKWLWERSSRSFIHYLFQANWLEQTYPNASLFPTTPPHRTITYRSHEAHANVCPTRAVPASNPRVGHLRTQAQAIDAQATGP